MTKLLLSLMLFGVAFFSNAQSNGDIKLLPPSVERGSTMMKALADRGSLRESADVELSVQDLSDLMWAANGINRPDKSLRTAPSAMNRQDVDLYVFTKSGAYRYVAADNILKLVVGGDNRKMVIGGQNYDSFKNFPVFIVMVSDLSKFGESNYGELTAKNESTKMTAAMDAAYISQNINLFCAAVGWNTVPRRTMDNESIRVLLKLSDNQLPLLNNPVGYKK